MEKQDLVQFKDEIIHQFGIIAEDLKSDFRVVAEQVGSNTEKIESLREDMQYVKGTLDTMKLDVEFIKHELKQKVSRDEFAALEYRLSILETKVAQRV